MFAIAPPPQTAFTEVPALVRSTEFTSSTAGNDPFGAFMYYFVSSSNAIVDASPVTRSSMQPTSSSVTEAYRFSEPILPSNRRVTSMAMEFVETLPAGKQRDAATGLLESIKQTILSDAEFRELIPFTPIRPSLLDDGTILLEWAYSHGRAQFFIDSNVNDSYILLLDGSKGKGVPEAKEVSFNASSLDAVAIIASEFSARFA